jgi:hypothetical protein
LTSMSAMVGVSVSSQTGCGSTLYIRCYLRAIQWVSDALWLACELCIDL